MWHQKEMRTKTVWRNPDHPNYCIERSHAREHPVKYDVYSTQVLTELSYLVECEASFRNLEDAKNYLTF